MNSKSQDPQDPELELWRNSTQDVQPLKVRQRTLPPRRKINLRAMAEREHQAVLQESLHAEIEVEDFDSGDETQFRRDGISLGTLRKLRRGQYAVQACCDLHGLTRQQAHAETLAFLAEARAQNWRCIKIIHGKGLRSPQGLPVLKRRVETTLLRTDAVLAFCSAPPWNGGHGAVLVLLRRG